MVCVCLCVCVVLLRNWQSMLNMVQMEQEVSQWGMIHETVKKVDQDFIKKEGKILLCTLYTSHWHPW